MKRKDNMVLDTVLKIASIIATSISTIVKVVDMLQKPKNKHQKSNRPTKE